MEENKSQEQIALEKQKEKERLQKEKEKQKEKERLQKEKEKQKEKERLQKEKEKQKEKERLQKEKEKQKEKERLQKEKEKQKEKERLQKEKEKQKEKERLQKEKEKQKEKERLQKEKEKQKEKERLQKEKDSLNKQPKSSPSKPFVLTPKQGIDAKPLVSRIKEEKPKLDVQVEIKMIDDLSDEDINQIKQSEKENSLNKMQSIVEAREKLNNANTSTNNNEKEGKIKIGKISFSDDDQETEEIAVLKQRSNNQKSIENEMLSKKDNEIQNKLKEANATFGFEPSEYKSVESNQLFSSKIQDLMDKVQELEENNNILNETLDAVEKIEYDGVKLFDPDTFELSNEFITYVENIKQNDSSEKVAELENRLQEILVELDSYKNSVNSSVNAEENEPNEIVDSEQTLNIESEQTIPQVIETETNNQIDVSDEVAVEAKENTINNETIAFEEVKEISFMRKVLLFFVDSFNGMAYGLFATLIIGVIFEQLFALLVKIPALANYSVLFSNVQNGLKLLMGVGIALGISRSLKLDGLKLICATIAGGLASYLYNPELFGKNANPLTIYFVVIGTVGLIKLVFKKKTPVDIVLIPLFSVIVSVAINQIIYSPIDVVMKGLSNFINNATELQPLIMGIVIAVVMGMCLTAPISSAAIAISIGLDGIAGGAALVGCCVQMIGFAVMSRKDNNIGKVLSVGLGTSMLQFKNILKKPVIWLPTIIVSAILGPISTTVLNIKTSAVGAGMGTSGLVGIIQTFDVMGYDLKNWIIILGFLVVIPAILVLIFDILFRKMKLIKEKDLEI